MEKIAVYGAGRYGQSLASAIRSSGIEVSFFIDQYSSFKKVLGIPVYRIDEIRDKTITIFISIAPNPFDTAARTDICCFLKQHGFNGGVDFVEGMHRFPEFLKILLQNEILWMRPSASAMVNRDAVSRLETMLCDEKSREVLKKIVRFRETLIPDTYVEPDGQREYLPEDVDLLSDLDSLRLVDGGAYIGDTTAMFFDHCRKSGIRAEYFAAFEPDTGNIVKLEKEIKRLCGHDCLRNRFFLYPAGLWSSNTILQFTNTCTSSSSVCIESNSAGRTIPVCAVSLDSCLGAASPNFIKLDIEGAEIEAVRGAEKIISDQKPVLAVCVYHRPADLWELPFLIHSLNPGYRMFLRIHGHMGTSLVLYCCP